jgi:2-polyprenyl-3-methyl-5-hydroxy-6-metoxy-1,4-benzoquinol methylase
MKVSSLREMLKNRLRREQIYSTSEYWDSKAVEHEGDAISMWPNNNLNPFYHREQIALMDRLLPDIRGAAVLDVGCGTGRNSRYVAQRGATVHGFDFSSRAIAAARQKTQGPNPSYEVRSIFDLNEKARYDIALSWGTVAIACRNRDELLHALSRLAECLRPGGKLLLCEPIHRGFLHRVLDMGIEDFCTAMTEAGFIILSVHQLHFWPARLALGYITWPRWITATGYHLGQWTMRALGSRRLGDYKAIFATIGT